MLLLGRTAQIGFEWRLETGENRTTIQVEVGPGDIICACRERSGRLKRWPKRALNIGTYILIDELFRRDHERNSTFEEGKPTPGKECWLRNLISSDYITSEGTVHFQALKGKAIAPVDSERWSHELSGRLDSIARATIKQDGERAVERAREKLRLQNKAVPLKIRFMEVACATASSRGCDAAKTDVVFTSQSDDQAHADFVVFTTQTDEDTIANVRNLASKNSQSAKSRTTRSRQVAVWSR